MPANSHQAPNNDLLRADFEFGYTYTRTTGPIIGQFLYQLKQRKIVGIRGSAGQVIVPPVEYDPETAAQLSEIVEVSSAGEVTAFSWVNEARPRHGLQHAFAWALIKLDGADTAMLHMVDAGTESNIQIGSRVTARWAAQTQGLISDIECFEISSK